MSSSEIPADVASFIAEHIDSVVRLEVLLLLHSRAQSCMSADDLAKELRVDADWVASTLPALEAIGTLKRIESGYSYSPRTQSLDQTIRSLAQAYSERRVSIVSLIFAKPADPIRQFTDAFRFKREDKR